MMVYLWPADISRAFLFYLQVYGLQYTKRDTFVSACSMAAPVFLGVGSGDCKG